MYKEEFANQDFDLTETPINVPHLDTAVIEWVTDKDRTEKRVRESLMNGFYGKDSHKTMPLLCDILVGETQQSQESAQIVEENRPESQLATRVSSQSTLLTTLKHLTILRYNTPPTPTRQVDNRVTTATTRSC